jgi:membrane-associated phospholipid phosphatase
MVKSVRRSVYEPKEDGGMKESSSPSKHHQGDSCDKIVKDKGDVYFSSMNYEVDLPVLSVSGRMLTSVWLFTRSHLANQVKYTCDLFKFVPQGPRAQYFASLASAAGSEEFYCIAIPIMTWCIASYELSRAMVLLLCVNLYVGNSCKNLFCLPRPPLKYRWGGEKTLETGQGDRMVCVDALGFGWPSTHSCNAVSLPFAVLRTAYGSIINPSIAEGGVWGAVAAYTVAFLYASLVPMSRLVLGVHSAADVHAGMLYGVIGLRLWLSYHTEIGEYMDGAGILFVVVGCLAMIACHPRVKPLNYTFEESVCIISYTMGFLIGGYIGKSLGLDTLCGTDTGVLIRLVRIIVGYGIVLPAKAIVKELTGFMRSDIGKDKNIYEYKFGFGDCFSRILQYGVGYGVGCTLFAPFVFEKVLGI